MKKETFDKYLKTLEAMSDGTAIYDLKHFNKKHNVSTTFTNWLIKNRYLKKHLAGSYTFNSRGDAWSVIIRWYESRNEPKQPKPEPAGFAYPISVRCEQTDDREQCIKLLESVGYIYKGIKDKNHRSVVTNYTGVAAHVSCFVHKNDYDFGRYNIDHFDADLIRDIASVRTGDVWVKGEPFYETYNSRVCSSLPGIMSSVGQKISETTMRRPTIAEICDRYGYELNGMNIVKKSEPKPYPAPVKLTPLEEHEAEVIKLLKEIEADHGVSYSLTRIETTKTKLL